MNINSNRIKILMQPMTQQELAEAAGLSRVAITNMLSRGTCHPKSLIKIAAVLKVDPEELIRKENNHVS